MEEYRFIKREDKEFPEKLKVHAAMPVSLYVKGCLPDPAKKSVAIVGARKCSAYGQQAAEYFARTLAEYGVQIISGLALGIDSCAHRGCLNAGGKTFAVMGCGIEHVYPQSNRRLHEQIISGGGGILTELEPESPPLAYHFPIRNRIISALSDAVLVVEAERKSGSLITAAYALEQGVQVYAVPGRINDKLSAGTNELIYQGAAPAVSPEKMLEDLGVLMPGENGAGEGFERKLNMTQDELKLLRIISSNVFSVDELCRLSGFSPALVSSLLVQLEMKGSVYSPYPGSYAMIIA